MGRKRGSRFRKAIDAQEQYQQIEARQRKFRKRKRGAAIYRITKSEQRETNALKRLRDRTDLPSEFDMGEGS